MTISPSKVMRFARFGFVALGLGSALFGMWVEHEATRPGVPTEARVAAVKFHSNIVMVTPEAAHNYHLALAVFFSCLAGIFVTAFAERLLRLDTDEDDFK